MRVKDLNIELPLLQYLKLQLFGRFMKSDCKEQGFHLHRYQKSGLIRYIPRENLKYQGYYWTKYGKFANSFNRELFEFETKHKLLRISDNEEYIRELENSKHDYREYEYEYEAFYMAGKVPMWTTETEWTSDPKDIDDGELTGNMRDCHHMYYGYRVTRNKNGKLRLERSPLVDDILTIKNEYPYIKEKFVDVVYSDPIEYQTVYQK